MAFFGSWRLLYLTYGIAEFVVAFIMLKHLERRQGVISRLNFRVVYKEALANKNLIKTVSILFFLGFAIKVPMVPFHTWLPYAHGQAPTIGSVILAAIFAFDMLKLYCVWPFDQIFSFLWTCPP